MLSNIAALCMKESARGLQFRRVLSVGNNTIITYHLLTTTIFAVVYYNLAHQNDFHEIHGPPRSIVFTGETAASIFENTICLSIYGSSSDNI